MLELLGGRNKARIAKVVRFNMVSIFLVSVTSACIACRYAPWCWHHAFCRMVTQSFILDLCFRAMMKQ